MHTEMKTNGCSKYRVLASQTFWYVKIFSYVTKPAAGAHLGDVWGHQECLDNLSSRGDVVWCQFLRDGGQDLGVASEHLYIRWAGELRWRRNSLYFLPAWVVVTVCSIKKGVVFSLTCIFLHFPVNSHILLYVSKRLPTVESLWLLKTWNSGPVRTSGWSNWLTGWVERMVVASELYDTGMR